MKAIGFYQYLPVDNPECLVEVDLSDPTPSDRDLLVRVKAVSVNPVDTKVRLRQEGVAFSQKRLSPSLPLFSPNSLSVRPTMNMRKRRTRWRRRSCGCRSRRCRKMKRAPLLNVKPERKKRILFSKSSPSASGKTFVKTGTINQPLSRSMVRSAMR